MFPTTDRLYKTQQESQETYKSWSNPRRIDRRTKGKNGQSMTDTDDAVAQQLSVADPKLGALFLLSFFYISLHSFFHNPLSRLVSLFLSVFFSHDTAATRSSSQRPCDPPTQHSLTLFYGRGSKRLKKFTLRHQCKHGINTHSSPFTKCLPL